MNNIPTPKHIADCDSLDATELHEAYPAEYNSWRSRKADCKKHHKPFSSAFDDFRNFLRILGPCPEGHTLDRLNNDDPEYAPGKVAWKSKAEQNSNKSSNTKLTDEGGQTRTLAEWAAVTGTPAATIRQRINSGWSEHDAIHGRAKPALSAGAASTLWDDTPWPVGQEIEWHRAYFHSLVASGAGDPDNPAASAEEFFHATVTAIWLDVDERRERGLKVLSDAYSEAAESTPPGQVPVLPYGHPAWVAYRPLKVERERAKLLLRNAEEQLEYARLRIAAFGHKSVSSKDYQRFRLTVQRPVRYSPPPPIPAGSFAVSKPPEFEPSPFSMHQPYEPDRYVYGVPLNSTPVLPVSESSPILGTRPAPSGRWFLVVAEPDPKF